MAFKLNAVFHPAPLSSPPIRDEAFRSDPALGSELPQTQAGQTMRRVSHSSKGYILVPVGSCAGCLGVDIVAWQRSAAERGLALVLLTSASSAQAEQFRKQVGLTCPIISDPADSITSRLNVLWLGRPYLFSSDWHLLWVSNTKRMMYNPFMDQEFVKALQGGAR